MLTEEQEELIRKRELKYSTSRSGGKGGQNVNKVESRVEVMFDVEGSQALTGRQKHTVLSNYKGIAEGRYIRVVSDTHRAQLQNKLEVQQKLFQLLNRLLKPKKKRLATSPTRASKARKSESKKRRSEIKSSRRRISPD